MSKTDVALWCYKCMGWIGIGVDGCTGGVMYRAPYMVLIKVEESNINGLLGDSRKQRAEYDLSNAIRAASHSFTCRSKKLSKMCYIRNCWNTELE